MGTYVLLSDPNTLLEGACIAVLSISKNILPQVRVALVTSISVKDYFLSLC
jgi:hypothetical protein